MKRISFCDKPQYAAALGLFDGVHRGHSAVFRDTVTAAEENGLTPAAISFFGGSMTNKDCGKKLILPESEKRVKLGEAGIKALLVFRFEDVKEMTPREFIKLLTEKYGIKHIICGEDFRFGKNKTGGTDALYKLSKELGFGLTVTKEEISDGVKISSSLIREKIFSGDIKSANKLLGYDFYFRRIVINGNKIGRELGFPTINQTIPKSQITPRFGVYVSHTEFDGKSFGCLSNIGIKPTVAYSGKPLIETYIDNFEGDLYGRKIKVSLSGFVRGEEHFAGLSELKSQLQKDREFIKQVERENL